MQFAQKQSALVLITISALTACGGGGGGGGNSDNSNRVVNTTAPLADTGTPNQMQGTWKSSCLFDASEGVFINIVAEFTSSNARLSSGAYASPSCTGFGLQIAVETGYEVTGNKLLASGMTANTIEHTISSVSMMPTSSEIANALNEDRACGFTDWRANVAYNISACQEFNPFQQPILRDITFVNGNQLFTGGENDGIDGYPSEIDSAPLFKQ
ncbi:hypothetical protein [Bacterioplanoides sp.]|uniref:hypothetical protein n=1 Tax=Bacterioplanoides sp. TaxID=2066072 RepID=UPI003AFF648A